MIQYVCDSCGAVKHPADVWLTGLAAEAVGVTAARREVSIHSTWHRATAVHPLAVHFCSVECKDDYMARVFSPDAATHEAVVERTTKELVLESDLPGVETVVTKAEARKSQRKKSA